MTSGSEAGMTSGSEAGMTSGSEAGMTSGSGVGMTVCSGPSALGRNDGINQRFPMPIALTTDNFDACTVNSTPRPDACRNLFLSVLTAFALSACSQLGPKVLSTGRPLYNMAVQTTDSQQLLLNIVRQRYSDPILFLDVTSISSGFTREAHADLVGNLFPEGKGSSGGTLGGIISESPFITYAPNTGEKFVTQMLTPLDLRTVSLIVQAGWSIERVLLIAGESINQLRNTSSGSPEAQEGYLKYLKVVSSLRALQKEGQLSLGAEESKDGKGSTMSLLVAPAAVEGEYYRTVCESIKVACDGRPLKIRQAIGISSDGETLAVATRSIMSALYFLAQGVEVPAADSEDGVALKAVTIAGGPFDTSGSGKKLFHVASSSEEPQNAAVKVFYRDSWFYIEDTDIDSKTTFVLLSMLVMLQSGDTAKITPLITLPVG